MYYIIKNIREEKTHYFIAEDMGDMGYTVIESITDNNRNDGGYWVGKGERFKWYLSDDIKVDQDESLDNLKERVAISIL